jgi:arylsulfatase A-like enzyme
MSDRPNIVLILADDMGYGDFGCFNGGISHTPAIDQLVRDGVCLTQHYSASPVCAPARASLLTGRYPHRTGVIDTLELRGLDRLALRERTIADLLRQAGYATGLVGKWHNGALDARYHPNRRGFEEFAGFCGGGAPYFEWRLDRNGTRVDADGRYLTDVLSADAVDFVRRHRAEPFFLHLAYNAPHYPFQSLETDLAPYRETGRYTLAVSHIYGMLRSMDRGIARVLDALEREGLADNTLVLFSSDNGPQFGGTGEMCSDRFNCGFAGAKTLVYEGGIRLPMVLRWPAGLPRQHTIGQMIHFTDWLPTLLAVAGATPPADLRLDGINVMPVLQGEHDRVPEQRFWQWNRYAPVAECNAAMRDGRWKLVRPAIAELMGVSMEDFAMDVDAKYDPDKYTAILRDTPLPVSSATRPSQLFDLETDAEEANDCAAAHPDRVARMERELSRWFEEVESERQSIPPA